MSETTDTPAETKPEPAEDPAAVAADLRRRLNEAQAAKAAAERAAATATREATEARSTAIRNGEVALAAQSDAVSNAVTAGEARMVSLKRELSAAFAAGEYDKASDLQGEMAELGGNLANARAEKARMEAQRQEALRAPPPPQPPKPTPANDSVEGFIATRTQATADWLRKNRDVAFQGGQLSRKVHLAHILAEEAGEVPDTPSYFKFIESQLGMNKPAAAPPAAQTPSNGQGGRRVAPAAAPSRSADYGGGEKPRSGYISPEVVERAEWMGITPQELQAGIDAEERSGGFINGNPYRR